MKKWSKALIALVLVTSLLAGVYAYSTRTVVSASPAYVAISLSTQTDSVPLDVVSPDGVASDITLKYDTSGTHIKDGKLKVLVNIYPGPTSKSYPMYAGNVTSGVLPILSAFITIPPGSTAAQLDKLRTDTFSPTLLTAIDDYVSANATGQIRRLMAGRLDTGSVLSKGTDPDVALRDTNSELIKIADTIVSTALVPAGDVGHGTIDVGSAATDRSGTGNNSGLTVIDLSNPANATGTIDTAETWFITSGTGVKAATFYNSGGNTYTPRDSELLGAVTSGAKRTFTGLSINVTSGDFATVYTGTGWIEYDNSGGSGLWYKSGDQTGAGTQTYADVGNDEMSLYLTGTETPTVAITNTPATLAFGTVQTNSTYYAKGSAPSNPVVDGDCTFTITNTGSVSENITIKETNPTGGVGWTLTSGAPGSNTIRDTAYASGTNPASGVVLSTSEQSFVTNLAASGTKKWDFKRETGTFTDGVAKSSTITLTASAA